MELQISGFDSLLPCFYGILLLCTSLPVNIPLVWVYYSLISYSYNYTLMYIIKIKGKVKIPDYVQIRDEQFTLLAYFRADRPERALEKCGLGDKEERIREIIDAMPFGKLQKLEL